MLAMNFQKWELPSGSAGRYYDFQTFVIIFGATGSVATHEATIIQCNFKISICSKHGQT